MFGYGADQLADTYGYHPDSADLTALVDLVPPAEVLMVGRSVPDVRERVGAMRQVTDQMVGLPAGLYWFAGPSALKVMVVADGTAPAGSDVVGAQELTEDHPLSWAEGWMDSLWAEAIDIPVPRYRVHDDVVVKSSGRDFPVRRRRFSGGKWLYEIRADGQTTTYAEDMLGPLEVGDDPVAWTQGPRDSAGSLSATLTREKLSGSFTDTVFSFRATRTLFRPYQFRPVIRMLESGKSRILIADEVGLGKTIEAGLIWTELEARGAADRVLVICPASLVGKWRNEMEERFGFYMTELAGSYLAEFEERLRENRLPRRFAHVISMERLRTWDAIGDLVGVAGPLNLAIVDEAHVMRNSETRSFATGSLLSEWAEALVLLTATPINLRNQDLFNLLELLTPGEFGEGDELISQLEPNTVLNRLSAQLADAMTGGHERRQTLDELRRLTFGQPLARRPEYALLKDLVSAERLTPRQVVEARRYIGDLNVLSSVLTRTRRVEVDEKKAVREAVDTRVKWTSPEERFYSAYVDWCRARADHAGVPVGFAMQMPLRLASACLPAARQQVLAWDRADAAFDDDGDSSSSSASAVPALRPHPDLLAAAEAMGEIDTKYAEFEPKLLEVLASGRRALVFTFSRPTLQYLARRLKGRCRVAVLHGGVPKDKRHEIIADFRAGAYDVVLANRVASEGLDFEFCSVVVNYDLPWNPMEVEQRIGRIDRIGQAEDKIIILNMWCPAALDEQIKQRLLDRIGVFEGSIGALEPIITEHLSDLRDAVFDFGLSGEERERKVAATLAAIEAQRSGLEDLASASPFLLAASAADVAGLEQDIVSTGRYVGSAELVRLLEDWARMSAAPLPVVSADGRTLRLRGNREMADRLQAVVAAGRLRLSEIDPYYAALLDETELHLSLDHEAARTSRSVDLLSARHPLILAATHVPEQRQARFASVSLSNGGALEPGRLVVFLGVARWGSVRPGQEIWGTAVTWDGKPAADEYVDLLLSRLASGDWHEGPRDMPQGLSDLVADLQSRMDQRMV
ncbi:DEAD/DEAH box helicase, partial [Geodermatophilus sp. SYSU D01176]